MTDGDLLEVLKRARSLGFLGPGPLRVHQDHALQFLPPLVDLEAGRVLDLGSGGGLPGLVVALERPDLELALLDASTKRCAFLLWAVGRLGLSDRVVVLEGRAEVLVTGRRGTFDAVTARGFGPPSQTVECALGFLGAGGRLILSEPPERRAWISPEIEGCELAVREDWPGVVSIERLGGSVPAWIPRPIKRQRAAPIRVFQA